MAEPGIEYAKAKGETPEDHGTFAGRAPRAAFWQFSGQPSAFIGME